MVSIPHLNEKITKCMFTINALSIREANGAMLMKMPTIKVGGECKDLTWGAISNGTMDGISGKHD